MLECHQQVMLQKHSLSGQFMEFSSVSLSITGKRRLHQLVSTIAARSITECTHATCTVWAHIHCVSLPNHHAAAVLGYASPQGLPIDDKSAAKLKATADELVEERQLALECIGEAH